MPNENAESLTTAERAAIAEYYGLENPFPERQVSDEEMYEARSWWQKKVARMGWPRNWKNKGSILKRRLKKEEL